MKSEMFKVNVVSLCYKQKYDTTEYPIINNSKKAADILYQSWDKDTIALEEQFKVLYLNHRNQVIGLYTVSVGGVTGTFVCNKKILACGLKIVASGMIIAHNHPSGNLKPSKADEQVTQKIKEAAKYHDIAVIDHLIVSEEGYFSFSDEGII
jgi:DNA repair protein RadC